MRNKALTGLAALSVMASTLVVGAPAAMADETAASAPSSIVVDGQEYGVEDGLTTTEESFDVSTGEQVGATWATAVKGVHLDAAWGASYAISKEIAYVSYRGTAKAAGNVYAGKRIVQVCMWYTRDKKAVTGTKCSDAVNNGSWKAGGEVALLAADSLVPDAPHTLFHIRTSRIAPGVN
ncbi:hypothetical protein ITJ44_05590 [Clavibacter sp. VKM Ac-2873]|uniref:hypothetical protein n=1 Tax=Clavibacter sp. VKM Ac-2873 TaxID=2783813 RepID=UPI00188CDCD9|nr:hypothetical protein [Clavibacter sp. VKM Ac-2873]MBF4617543.1 hypothetical protein [Clavibacter sp. VKM Ac-2873]